MNLCPQAQVRTKCNSIYISFKATLSPQSYSFLSWLGSSLLPRVSPDSSFLGRGVCHGLTSTPAPQHPSPWWSFLHLTVPCGSHVLLGPEGLCGSAESHFYSFSSPDLCPLPSQGKASERPFPGTLDPVPAPRPGEDLCHRNDHHTSTKPVSQRHSAPFFKFYLPFESQVFRKQKPGSLHLPY